MPYSCSYSCSKYMYRKLVEIKRKPFPWKSSDSEGNRDFLLVHRLLQEAVEGQQISKNQCPFQCLGSNKSIMGKITFLLSSHTLLREPKSSRLQYPGGFYSPVLADVPFCRSRQQQGWAYILQQKVQTHTHTHTPSQYTEKIKSSSERNFYWYPHKHQQQSQKLE